ncbi:MAG TPA: PucR family transcriptional regulator ligand-binding domain-containing protein [Solirubrobacterales bacterium]|nr:PucR family transcriptional regulator ligand-binding domain-containing protein [Solirubrobacterales bacterium]
MLTVESLLDDLGLEPAFELSGRQRPIRWVHISELEDPTPFLSGGELLLTTGINLGSAAKQRRFAKLLDGSGVAAIGLGTGFDHEGLPTALRTECESLGLALFEVPYETPFIAITERAFTTLVNEQYDVLERGIEEHAKLEGLVLAERGLGAVMEAIAESVGGAALLLDDRGRELARHPQERGFAPDAVESIRSDVVARAADSRRSLFVPDEGPLAGRAVAIPVPIGGHGPRGHWLIAARKKGTVGDLERLLGRQAAMVVALELMRERAVRDTERRLAGDVLAEAVGGNLGAEELAGRLAPFGIGGPIAVMLFDVEERGGDVELLTTEFARAGVPALVAVNTAAGRPLLCAIVEPGESDPVQLARDARAALGRDGRDVRASVSRPVPLESLRRAFHEARCALEATAMSNGSAPDVASHEDLGAFTLLLSVQDDEALRTYADNLLAPIEDGEGEYGPELLRSLEAFIERNGQWERAARDLYCHRHTLRYRIKRVEELTGRDLGQAQDRIELWLALRARELVR